MFNSLRPMLIIGIAWPILVTLVVVLWPGPRPVPEFHSANAVGGEPTVLPPFDSGTQLAVAGDGSARIFWSVPEEGVIELTIEIDGQPDGESPVEDADAAVEGTGGSGAGEAGPTPGSPLG